MATAELTQHLKVTVGGVVKEFGSKSTPVDITVTNEYVYETRTIVQDDYESKVLWLTGDGNITSFSLLWFESDADGLIELRNDTATDEFLLFEVKAGVPLVLTSEDCRGRDDGTSPIGDGAGSGTITTLNDVDQISFQRNVAAAGGDALVHLAMFN